MIPCYDSVFDLHGVLLVEAMIHLGHRSLVRPIRMFRSFWGNEDELAKSSGLRRWDIQMHARR